MFKWAIYSLLCVFADTLDAIFFSTRRPQSDFFVGPTLNYHTLVGAYSSEVDGLRDEEIIKLMEPVPKLLPSSI
jgi:hypothetical protein